MTQPSALAALQVVAGQQALQEQKELARLRTELARLHKSIVFPRLLDISLDFMGEQTPQTPRPWSTHQEPDAVEQYNTVGLAMYDRAFRTTPREALEFLRQTCASLQVPPPSHSWEDILQITSGQRTSFIDIEEGNSIIGMPITDHHRLFAVLGLIPHDQNSHDGETWRHLLWNWPLLTPHKLFNLANAVAIPRADGTTTLFCDKDEVEAVLTLSDDIADGGAQMLATDTCLNE